MDGAFVLGVYKELHVCITSWDEVHAQGSELFDTLADFLKRVELFRDGPRNDARNLALRFGVLGKDPGILRRLLAKHERGVHNIISALGDVVDALEQRCAACGDVYHSVFQKLSAAELAPDDATEPLWASAPDTLGADARLKVRVPSIVTCVVHVDQIYRGFREEMALARDLVAKYVGGVDACEAAARAWRCESRVPHDVRDFVHAIHAASQR